MSLEINDSVTGDLSIDYRINFFFFFLLFFFHCKLGLEVCFFLVID